MQAAFCPPESSNQLLLPFGRPLLILFDISCCKSSDDMFSFGSQRAFFVVDDPYVVDWFARLLCNFWPVVVDLFVGGFSVDFSLGASHSESETETFGSGSVRLHFFLLTLTFIAVKILDHFILDHDSPVIVTFQF